MAPIRGRRLGDMTDESDIRIKKLLFVQRLSYRIKLQKELWLNSFLLEFQYVQQLARMIVKE